MTGCLVCGVHIKTGSGLLVANGEVTGDSSFIISSVLGIIHEDCLEDDVDVPADLKGVKVQL